VQIGDDAVALDALDLERRQTIAGAPRRQQQRDQPLAPPGL